jgi:hypothetical protein
MPASPPQGQSLWVADELRFQSQGSSANMCAYILLRGQGAAKLWQHHHNPNGHHQSTFSAC